MSTEYDRRLRLSDNSIVSDQKRIDEMISRRSLLRELKASVSPVKLLQGLDLNQANLIPMSISLEGYVQMIIDNEVVYENPLYEIPDVWIDLSPEAEDLPRQVEMYQLVFPERSLAVEVCFDETSSRYWPLYKNEGARGVLVEQDLLKTLKQQEGWQADWRGWWYIAG